MGVINITPDSFSDGGDCLEPELAAQKSLELSNEGADVIDLGAQSTRPNSYQIGSNEELKRLKPALKLIRKLNPDLLISIDTYHSHVAETALE